MLFVGIASRLSIFDAFYARNGQCFSLPSTNTHIHSYFTLFLLPFELKARPVHRAMHLLLIGLTRERAQWHSVSLQCAR